MTDVVLSAMEKRGWQARLVPVGRCADLWRELEDRLARGELDASLFESYLRPLEKAAHDAPEWVRSILIVSIPVPAASIGFAWRGREVTVGVPPTYLHWREIDGSVREVLQELIEGTGECAEPVNVPKKLLATRTGLARYGRNNITYVDGVGSYHRLVALQTSLPCEAGPWGDPEPMPSCAACRACVEACPTGVIGDDRFLLRAERCITYWNEQPGEVAFPPWIHPTWHNQLVGCLRCQEVCPVNAGCLTTETRGPAFTETETEALLQGVPIDELPDETVAKLEQHDLLDYLEAFPRNLRVLLDREPANDG